MPATYESIATTTLGSAQSSVTFSSISSTYTDLIAVIRTKVTSATNVFIKMTFNNDTASNYSYTRFWGNGTSAVSDRSLNQPEIDAGFLPGTDGTAQGTIIAQIMNYSNSTTYKTAIVRWESQGAVSNKQYTLGEVAMWRSTSAINRIDFTPNGANFAAGSTLTLYGIKAA